jgi:RNA polymerase sigma-70 factor (ECF subfamily)
MSGWLRSILRNLHRDDLRRQRRRGTMVEWEDTENLIALSAPPEDRGTAHDVVRAMNALSVEHREILLLVALEERSYREIADELGIPMGTVMSRLARARAQLRHRLEEDDSPDAPTASGRNAGKAAAGT